MADITLKQLRYFATAGELKSVTRAAQKLYVSQPSISAAISHIEQMAGTPLFIRHHAQGLSLTHAGEAILERTRALLADANSLKQFTVSQGEDIAGPLHVSAFTTFAHILLPPLMKEFQAHYPQVQLRFDENHQESIIRGLHHGKYEVAFGYDMNVPDDISFVPLYEYPPYVVVRDDHPLASRDEVTFAELAEYDMIILDWPLSRDYFIGLFNAAGVRPTIAHHAISVGMARELVSQGFGFTLFNIPLEHGSSGSHPSLHSIPLAEPARTLVIGILTLKDVQLPPAAEAMYQFAMDRAGMKPSNKVSR